MPKIVDSESFFFDEFEGQSLHIVGSGGKLGQDLGKVSMACGLAVEPSEENADFIALCTPSHVAGRILEEVHFEGKYEDKTIIDLSGAAKRMRHYPGTYSYGLMRSEAKPWDNNFNTNAKIYGNPGCIASAVILGLGAAGLAESSGHPPDEISVFSVGGRSHTHSVEDGAITLARRLNDHPHVQEIQNAYHRRMKVASFMPTICDVPSGLLVGVHGKTRASKDELHEGYKELNVKDVVGTHFLKHKLEVNQGVLNSEGQVMDFSLAVVIDNIRFVTTNVIHLLRYLKQERAKQAAPQHTS
jgi:N-acetyl-gamma-glutamylphosphate reductase